MKSSIIYAERVLDPPMTKTRRAEKKTYGTQSFSKVTSKFDRMPDNIRTEMFISAPIWPC